MSVYCHTSNCTTTGPHLVPSECHVVERKGLELVERGEDLSGLGNYESVTVTFVQRHDCVEWHAVGVKGEGYKSVFTPTGEAADWALAFEAVQSRLAKWGAL